MTKEITIRAWKNKTFTIEGIQYTLKCGYDSDGIIFLELNDGSQEEFALAPEYTADFEMNGINFHVFVATN